MKRISIGLIVVSMFLSVSSSADEQCLKAYGLTESPSRVANAIFEQKARTGKDIYDLLQLPNNMRRIQLAGKDDPMFQKHLMAILKSPPIPSSREINESKIGEFNRNKTRVKQGLEPVQYKSTYVATDISYVLPKVNGLNGEVKQIVVLSNNEVLVVKHSHLDDLVAISRVDAGEPFIKKEVHNIANSGRYIPVDGRLVFPSLSPANSIGIWNPVTKARKFSDFRVDSYDGYSSYGGNHLLNIFPLRDGRLVLSKTEGGFYVYTESQNGKPEHVTPLNFSRTHGKPGEWESQLYVNGVVELPNGDLAVGYSAHFQKPDHTYFIKIWTFDEVTKAYYETEPIYDFIYPTSVKPTRDRQVLSHSSNGQVMIWEQQGGSAIAKTGESNLNDTIRDFMNLPENAKLKESTNMENLRLVSLEDLGNNKYIAGMFIDYFQQKYFSLTKISHNEFRVDSFITDAHSFAVLPDGSAISSSKVVTSGYYNSTLTHWVPSN